MMTRLTSALIGVALSCATAVAAPLNGQETYDLLFKNGTLDEVSRDTSLVYQREVSNALAPDAAERDSGKVALTVGEGESPMAVLELRQGEKYRKLGQFPASVGNPMIMFFYESTVRDMAESAGGSKFYIRNRVKEALVQPNEVTMGEAEYDGETVETQTVTMQPFAEDPNRAQMRGFGDLELTVTMSEDVPGWYLSLLAEAPGPEGGEGYRSEVTFETLEEATQ
ncbi:hypothetical protein PVV74_21135 [Roseovarius sp. SK2]|jgi:hypothetical protein|uniref:hypothetical protein n=1 Tax=Roseovarius TaxID=74030 RepID=UPI00237AFF43|nr:hypothetical protein [Roseovarius sp. SK2]MDD9727958.1 hypothetical protein [Roseovarius sp. SK2]